MIPSKKFTWGTAIVYLLLVLGALVVLYPFAYMVMNSFKFGPEILNSPTRLPTKLTLTGFQGVFQDLNMLLLFKNSLILAVSITFLNTFLSAMAGYAIAKIPFPGSKQIFSFMLATMMIPGVLFLIPTYVMMYRLGWVGHFYALIIPSAISVYNIFLIRQFVIGIPNEQIEAARLDGANDIQIFTKIILPLSRPVLATVAILSFIGSWNDFLASISVDIRSRTAPVFRPAVPGSDAVAAQSHRFHQCRIRKLCVGLAATPLGSHAADAPDLLGAR